MQCPGIVGRDVRSGIHGAVRDAEGGTLAYGVGATGP